MTDFSLSYIPFAPMNGANTHAQVPTTTVAATTTAANATLPVGDDGNSQIEIFNASTGVASINFGDAGVTAVVAGTGYPVAPGARRVVSLPRYVTTVSVLSSIAGNVSFTRGMGAN